jgi:hypothetical protein
MAGTPRLSDRPADFADYLISYTCGKHEAGPVYTLDRKAAKHPGFALVR